jgi:hypothetical protein
MIDHEILVQERGYQEKNFLELDLLRMRNEGEEVLEFLPRKPGVSTYKSVDVEADQQWFHITFLLTSICISYCWPEGPLVSSRVLKIPPRSIAKGEREKAPSVFRYVKPFWLC